MKHIFIISFCIIFIFFPNFTKAELADSAITDVRDSLPNKNSSKGIDWIAIYGLGMTSGSTFGEWDNAFYNGPCFALGLEIPFSKSHIFAFELYGHSWLSKFNEQKHNDIKSDYYNISGDFYSQFGFSTVVKYYMGKVDSPLRYSIHFGFMLISTKRDYKAIDFGIAINYYFCKKYTVSLSSRVLMSPPAIDGSSERTPNLLMLNFSYKFKSRKESRN